MGLFCPIPTKQTLEETYLFRNSLPGSKTWLLCPGFTLHVNMYVWTNACLTREPAQCQAFVGTFSSNFGRLAYEMAYARRKADFFGASMDVFWHAYP